MRILICTDNFYPCLGGTEAACLGYANALLAAGHEVMLACPTYRQKDSREYPFEVVRMKSLHFMKTNPIALVKLARLKKLVEFRPDIVHVETLSGMARIGLKVGKKCDAPVVMTMHTKILDAFRRYLKSDLLARLLLKHELRNMYACDEVVTVANCMRRTLVEYGWEQGANIRVIRNGCTYEKKIASDEERIAARAELGLSAEENVLLYTGSIVAYKNLAFLLQAFAKAKEKGFRGKFILVGGGPDRTAFEKLSAKLAISDDVIFTGPIADRNKLSGIYAAADLFLMASVFDNDPMVVVEAASLGVPSLTVAGAGCSERIEDNVSGFHAPLDEDVFAARIVELFQNKSILREVGAVAADRIPTPWAETVEAHIPIYESLISARKEARSGRETR